MSYSYNHSLVRLNDKTAFLYALHNAGAPDDEIRFAFDQLCHVLFGVVDEELTGELTPSDTDWLQTCPLDEFKRWGERNGFDFYDGRTEDGLVVEWYGIAYMVMAKEKGFFPSTEEEWKAVNLRREAAKFALKRHKERQQSRQPSRGNEEVVKVFGRKSR